MGCIGKAAFGSAHKAYKLLSDNLDDHLRGGKAFHNLFTDCLFGYGVCEILGYLIVDIRFEQSHTNLAHCAANISLREASFTAEIFKRGFKPVGKTFKCQFFHLLFLVIL